MATTLNDIVGRVDKFFADIPYKDAAEVSGDSLISARGRSSGAIQDDDGVSWELADILITGEHDGSWVNGRQLNLARFMLDGTQVFFSFVPGNDELEVTGDGTQGLLEDVHAEFIGGLATVLGDV